MEPREEAIQMWGEKTQGARMTPWPQAWTTEKMALLWREGRFRGLQGSFHFDPAAAEVLRGHLSGARQDGGSREEPGP